MSSPIQALTRAQVIQRWPSGSDFVFIDLWTGKQFTARGGPPINYDHSDWQYKTKADFDLSRSIAARSWSGRPALLVVNGQIITALSYHTFNHSIRVASGAYDIVSPAITRATEKDKNGNWVPGHHMCMHYEDSYKARSNTSYTRDMRDKVLLAVQLANQAGYTMGAVKPPEPTTATISSGSTNSVAVREIQDLINQHGYTPKLTVDGGFGPLTKAGVEWFQKTFNLPVTGSVDAATWAKLRQKPGTITIDIKEEGTLVTIYNKVEQVPEWARPTIKKLVDAKILNGVNAAGDLNLNDDLIRMIVLNERINTSGIYKS